MGIPYHTIHSEISVDRKVARLSGASRVWHKWATFFIGIAQFEFLCNGQSVWEPGFEMFSMFMVQGKICIIHSQSLSLEKCTKLFINLTSNNLGILQLKVTHYDDEDDIIKRWYYLTMIKMTMAIIMEGMKARGWWRQKTWRYPCVCVCDLTDQANDDRSPYFHKNRGTNVNSTF